jgi:biopolymer transport protein ExbB/TolQ
MPTLAYPILASGALQFAFEKATTEGKITICVLILVSMFSWTVIITKTRQLWIANRAGKRFFAAFRESRDPLELTRNGQTFDGAPAFELYATGTEELQYNLKNNSMQIATIKRLVPSTDPAIAGTQTDMLARSITTKISYSSFESVRVALERAASEQALALEKGMIVLSTAVAGGPFIGLLGTVWGVMETFSGVARANSASLTAMAPGVAGALIATVIGLMVAIPAMFAYNFMVTKIRGITQQLDNFASELATAMEHAYVDNRPLSEELAEAIRNVERNGESSRLASLRA